MLISAYNACLEGSAVAPGGPDVANILQKVNKSLFLKEKQNLSFTRL